MDLSNWGPVGTPDQIATWIAHVRRRRRRPLHLPVRRARPVRAGRAVREGSAAPVHTRASGVTRMPTVSTSNLLRGRGPRRRRLLLRRGGRRRHDHLRRRAPRDEARAVAEVCVERGAWPVVMNNETQVRRGRADVRFPMAPPRNLHQAMVGSDEVIIITNLEWANRFAHVSAVKETCAANGKIARSRTAWGRLGSHRRGHPRRPRSGRATRWRCSRGRSACA